ncbi:hypothetical protein H310_07832 [Aphanomyces invadans]|uniref:MIT domain-containing protein n=1 Tax=Aphanomyces invadans TaxID=157072 RepID=A0A024U0J3_9STRA|nr:hypothetical protein H310_07832 [Aphanomyces invadans]ETV99788.1 hypothetical protein H310_07832 [Aphanomyces invadans]|eukprot:XP_008871564.1 hypothetical protein H310_07832 [Aphanomyces invadans]
MPSSPQHIANAVTAESVGDVPQALVHYAQAIAAIDADVATCKDPVQRRQLQEAATMCQDHLHALTYPQLKASHGDMARSPSSNGCAAEDVLPIALDVSTSAKHGITHEAGGEKVMMGSAAAAAGVGLLVAGPVGCILGAAGGAVLATQGGTSGDLARATGQLIAISYDKAKVANKKYHVTDNVKAGVMTATATAKTLDDMYHIQAKATTLARAGMTKLTSFNHKHHVTERVAMAAVSGIHGLTKALGSPSKQP